MQQDQCFAATDDGEHPVCGDDAATKPDERDIVPGVDGGFYGMIPATPTQNRAPSLCPPPPQKDTPVHLYANSPKLNDDSVTDSILEGMDTHDGATDTGKEPAACGMITDELLRRAKNTEGQSQIRIPKLYPRQIFPEYEENESKPAEIPEKLVAEFQESVDYNKSFLAKLQERQNELEKEMEELCLSDDDNDNARPFVDESGVPKWIISHLPYKTSVCPVHTGSLLGSLMSGLTPVIFILGNKRKMTRGVAYVTKMLFTRDLKKSFNHPELTGHSVYDDPQRDIRVIGDHDIYLVKRGNHRIKGSEFVVGAVVILTGLTQTRKDVDQHGNYIDNIDYERLRT